MKKLKLKIHKLTHWEYWSFQVVYIPMYFVWLYYSAKAKSIFFFSASNTLSEAFALSDGISGKDSPHTFCSVTMGGFSKGLLARSAEMMRSVEADGEAGMACERLRKVVSG